MRGASALDDWLLHHPDTEAFVVWEPVLESDEAPPRVAWRVAHARNYWDPGRLRSTAMRGSGADPSCLSSGSADEEVVWDALFDYAPGARTPAFCGRTILQALPRLR